MKDVKKNNAYWSNIHKNINQDNSLKNTEFKKIFLIPYSTVDEPTNDTSLNSLR